MTRRSETVWWLCVCATLSALAALVTLETPNPTPPIHPALEETIPQVHSALTEFNQALVHEHFTVRKAKLLLAVARASEKELQSMVEQVVHSSEPIDLMVDEDLLRHILHRYTALNPEGALAFMLATPGAQPHSHLVFHNWGRLNFAVARQTLNTLPPNQRQQAAINALEANTHLPLSDFAEYQRQLNLPDTNPAFARWASERIVTKPIEGWARVQTHGSEPYAHQYLANWMQRDAKTALAALQSADYPPAELAAAFNRVARYAPRQALDWLDENQGLALLQSQKVALLGELAATAPQDAWQRSTNVQHTYRLPSQANILAVWGDYQPDEAAQWLLRYGDTSQMQSSLGRLAVRQTTKQAAYDLLRFIDDAELQRHTAQQLQEQWPG